MRILLPPTSSARRPDFCSMTQREQAARLQDLVIVPPPGQSPQRARPSAETLIERLRKMQMQGWG